jgi:hypothetical protein
MSGLSTPDIRFGRFLFAPVLKGDDHSVTVLSALTRLDLDAWQEAARLSELPPGEAINSLAASIWKTSSGTMTAEEAAEIAARLIRLLPQHHTTADDAGTHAVVDFPMMWFALAIFIGMMAVSGNQSTQPKATSATLASQQTEPAPHTLRTGFRQNELK